MLKTIEDQVLINFITDDKNLIAFYNASELLNIVSAQYTSCGVVWRIDHDGFCSFTYFVLNFFPVYFIPGKSELNGNGFCTIKFYSRDIRIVRRLKHNYFISRLQNSC